MCNEVHVIQRQTQIVFPTQTHFLFKFHLDTIKSIMPTGSWAIAQKNAGVVLQNAAHQLHLHEFHRSWRLGPSWKLRPRDDCRMPCNQVSTLKNTCSQTLMYSLLLIWKPCLSIHFVLIANYSFVCVFCFMHEYLSFIFPGFRVCSWDDTWHMGGRGDAASGRVPTQDGFGSGKSHTQKKQNKTKKKKWNEI